MMRAHFVTALALGLLATSARGAAPGSAFDASIAAAKASMMGDPSSSLAMVARAEAIAANMPSGNDRGRAVATARWLHGEALSRTNRPTEALPVLAEALRSAQQAAAPPKLIADILLAKGNAEAAVSDVRTAFGDLQSAYRHYVGAGDARGEAKALLIIGGVYSDAGDYQHSLRYYAMVPEVYHGDPAITLSAHNNLGETLRRLGRFSEAAAEYRLALAAAREIGSVTLQAGILPNLASAQLSGGRADAAQATLTRALQISKVNEAAGERPFIWGICARLALSRGDLVAARQYIERTFSGVDLDASARQFRDFHETAFRIYDRSDDPARAVVHLKALWRLDTEEKQLSSSMSAALATARFDFATQGARIDRLKASQERQSAQIVTARARSRLLILGVLLGAGALLLVTLTIGFIAVARSRNRERAANADLQQTNYSLERALKVKTEFLATTSHEIRTPLNGILGMTQVLLASPRIDPEVRDRVAVVHGAGETMRALVDDILDVAKIETGLLTLARAPMNLCAVLRDASHLWQVQAEAKGLSFVVDLENCPEWIEEDEDRLRQIAFNLLSNATKFTEAGGITLRASLTEGSSLSLTVADTGIGIAAEHFNTIFESFRQVDGGTSRRYGGTGLGLSISRSLAEAMGGTVNVKSCPGEGSMFELSLPVRLVQVDASDQVRASASEPVRALKDAHLLMLQANQLTSRVLARIIMPKVAKLSIAMDLAAAEEILEHGPTVHHLLLDADGMAGNMIETCASLQRLVEVARQLPGTRTTIMLTPDTGDLLAAVARLGADQLIMKPIQASQLIGALAAGYDRKSENMPAVAPALSVG